MSVEEISGAKVKKSISHEGKNTEDGCPFGDREHTQKMNRQYDLRASGDR